MSTVAVPASAAEALEMLESAMEFLADADAAGMPVEAQDKWIAEYRAKWAAHRAAASVGTGDGGAWLEGDAAREVACDAMIIGP